jgi:DNA polymerase-3 subunit delta'
MNAPPPRENPLLIGHEAAEHTLVDALRGGRLHHAWLITGPEGVGRATLAYRFARRLLAGGTDTLEMDPAHLVFRRVAAGTHADLLTIEREWDDKKKRMKKNIAAEAVREIPGFLHLTPAEGGWRVVILDGAEDMNAHSANALLKVLEEPPARAVLMLISAAPGRLLPTLRSRCRTLSLSPLAPHAMDQVLRTYLPDMAGAQRAALAEAAQGAPGLALALSDQDGLAITGMVAEITAALPHFPLLRGYEMADALRDEAAFDMFFTLLRQTIAAATTATLRGTADAAQQRLASLRTPADWGETWARMGQIHAETERSNLDKRQAVVTALALLG